MGRPDRANARIEIEADHLIATRESLNKVLALHTGQPVDVIAKDTDRDRFMSSGQAREYGLVDEVLTKSDDTKKKSSDARIPLEYVSIRSVRRRIPWGIIAIAIPPAHSPAIRIRQEPRQ